jgi:hypothetical protein
MGIGVSLLLIAAGAILAWGVTGHVSGLDINAIGIILLVIGIIGLILTMIFWHSWWGPGYWRRTSYAGPRRRSYGYRAGAARGGYVEEEEVREPPPGGPPY